MQINNSEIPPQRNYMCIYNAEASCSIAPPEFVKANLNPLATRKNLGTQEFMKNKKINSGSDMGLVWVNGLRLFNFEKHLKIKVSRKTPHK